MNQALYKKRFVTFPIYTDHVKMRTPAASVGNISWSKVAQIPL